MSKVSIDSERASVPKGQATYTLQVGSLGEQRLGILNELYNPSTLVALDQQIERGARRVLDVACGLGQTANWMAQRLAPLGGSVLGVDISASQLEIARRGAADAAISNVAYQELSVFELERLKGPFDLIYARFILVHIDDPERVIASMRDLLAPDGVVLCEEATASACYSRPAAACVDRFLDLWRHLRQANNAQLDLGGALTAMFERAGLRDVAEHTVQPMLDTPRKRSMFRLNVIETKAAAIATGFASGDALDQLIAELAQWEASDCVAAYMRIHQVSGRSSRLQSPKGLGSAEQPQ